MSDKLIAVQKTFSTRLPSISKITKTLAILTHCFKAGLMESCAFQEDIQKGSDCWN